MPRKPMPKQSEQRELEAFAERYDTLSTIYADPVQVVFEIMTRADDELRLRAAETLMAYRYPKLKALENKKPQEGPSQVFNIVMQQAQPQLETAKHAPVIELNSAPTALKRAGS